MNLKNKTAAVLGLGISNLPLVDILLSRGASVVCRDKKERGQLTCAEALEAKGARLICGKGYLEGLCEDYIFRSPGIRPDTPEIAAAVASGSVLTSEMELFFDETPADIVAVTGSDGKTTTTTLTYLMLESAYATVFLGGNIGEPLLPRVPQMKRGDIAVAELSSFQLMTMKRAPRVAVMTNISPNHLNWHTGMDEYVAAKANILGEGCETAVFNLDNGVTEKLCRSFGGKRAGFSRKLTQKDAGDDISRLVWLDGGTVTVTEGDKSTAMNTAVIRADELKLPGAHNLEDFMAALCAVCEFRDIGDSDVLEACRRVAREFGGVEHRCEFVRETGGVRFYNSSIDSSPTRTNAALNALSSAKGIVLILGGESKHIPLEPLAEAVYSHVNVHTVVLTGATASDTDTALASYQNKRPLRIIRRDRFDEAVAAAADAAAAGDIVLLSPAFTSFDAFGNFEERGNRFKAIVNAL